MQNGKASDAEFIAAFKSLGSPDAVARAFGMNVRSVYKRRNAIERKTGRALASWTDDRSGRSKIDLDKIGARKLFNISDGCAIIFSDGHFWPGERSTGFDALITLIKDLKPKIIINNGDAFDGARISRHPPTEWAHMPTVQEELDAVQERLGEIESVAPKGCPLHWNMGNHDSRFSMRLAQAAPDFQGVKGFDLPDHFPAWTHSWSLMLNPDHNDKVMVKHRNAGGIHATYNNTLRSGVNIVTGHLHKCQVTPWTDYNGRRYGVDTGTLSDFGPDVQKFIYAEDNPLAWGQGFAVLTFDKAGRLLPPELCEVINDVAYFRGEAISIKGTKALKKSKKAAA